MKRPGLGLIALVVAFVVVFAPRPWVLDAPTASQDPPGHLIGRILSPSFSSGEIREPRYGHSIKDHGSLLWVVCATGLGLAFLTRKGCLQLDPPRRSRSLVAGVSQPSRAPPFARVLV